MGEDRIWIVGATGRIGRSLAERLVRSGLSPVLVGRDQTRLQRLSQDLGRKLRIHTCQSLHEMGIAISTGDAAVVVNTIGPFANTAPLIAGACRHGVHYVDLSNELDSVSNIFRMHEEALSSARTIVTGAGYGVLATECLVLKLCAGQAPATEVRVDAIAAVESEPGPIGSALASSMIDCLAAGSRKYVNGRLLKTRLFNDLEVLTTPDGKAVRSAGVPFGELEAARRASLASNVVCARSLVPPIWFLRVVAPAFLRLLFRVEGIRNYAKRKLATVTLGPPGAGDEGGDTKGNQVSWSRARVRWGEHTFREEWLRTGDAHDFTVAVLAEVATRLDNGEGRPGAFTPGQLFGWQLATVTGGSFVTADRSSDADSLTVLR